jgi:hypothetical protein
MSKTSLTTCVRSVEIDHRADDVNLALGGDLDVLLAADLDGTALDRELLAALDLDALGLDLDGLGRLQ